MFNANKLRGKIAEAGLSITEVSRLTGIEKSTFYRKMNDAEGSFTVKEVTAIAIALDLYPDDINAIFFA